MFDFINKKVRTSHTETTYFEFAPTLDNVSYTNNNDGTYVFRFNQTLFDFDWENVDNNPSVECSFDYWYWDNGGRNYTDGPYSAYDDYGELYVELTVGCNSDEYAEVIKTAMVNGEFTFDAGITTSKTFNTTENMRTDVDEPYITLWQESDIENDYDYGPVIYLYGKIGGCDPNNITITAMKKVE